MFDWAIGGLGGLFGLVGDFASDVVGWAWDKVTAGIYTWLANGLALAIEWVWSVLDSGTTPRVTDDWFANELAVQVGSLALAVTVAMMLASAMQAALAGRPEQIGDAVKHGAWSVVASALTVTVIDVMVRLVDEASAGVWQTGRGDLVGMLEPLVAVATTSGPLATTFVGPLCLLFGFLGLLGLTVALMMRNSLIYVAAALAPLVFAANTLPLFRGSSRKLVHLATALIVSKLAIVIALVLSVKLIANPSGDPDSGTVINDGAAAVGQLMTGFVTFVIAAVTPVVLYKLMPTIEGAAIGAGVAGGWGRTATTAAHTAMMVKGIGASAATRSTASAPRSARPGSIAGLTGTPDPTSEPGGGPASGLGPSASAADTANRAAAPRSGTAGGGAAASPRGSGRGVPPRTVERAGPSASTAGRGRESPDRQRRTVVPRPGLDRRDTGPGPGGVGG